MGPWMSLEGFSNLSNPVQDQINPGPNVHFVGLGAAPEVSLPSVSLLNPLLRQIPSWNVPALSSGLCSS